MTRQLFNQETAAVQRFAKAHGRRWKNELTMVYWYNARPWRGTGSHENDGGILHGLRNDPNWGHEALADYQLPAQEAKANLTKWRKYGKGLRGLSVLREVGEAD